MRLQHGFVIQMKSEVMIACIILVKAVGKLAQDFRVASFYAILSENSLAVFLWLRLRRLRRPIGTHPTTSAKTRIFKLRSRQIDHCLGQRATKAMVGGCLMGVYLTGVHLMGVHLTGVHLTGIHSMGMHLIGVHFTDI